MLVPLPGAPGDHQTANARSLSEVGGAALVPDAEVGPERLAAEVDAIVSTPGRLEAMAGAVGRLARPDAAERLAELAERHARRPSPGADADAGPSSNAGPSPS